MWDDLSFVNDWQISRTAIDHCCFQPACSCQECHLLYPSSHSPSPWKLNFHLQLACEVGSSLLFYSRKGAGCLAGLQDTKGVPTITADKMTRVTTFGISLLGPMFVYFANTNRYLANTCSFEPFYGSEYFILKCGVVHYFQGDNSILKWPNRK